MNLDKIYIIQIIAILLILLCLAMYVLCDKSQPYDYGYKDLVLISKNYEPTKQYYNYHKNFLKPYEKSEYDEKGILLTEFDKENIYHKANISFYGLMLYSNYIEENNIQSLEKAKKQAEYLVENQDEQSGAFYEVYEYKIYGTNEEMGDYWCSSTTQGQALSLLSRIYSVTKEEKFKKACELALIPFTKKIEENGIYSEFFGHSYYEEFPTEKSIYSLSGFLYSLLGLYDYYAISEDENAKKLYDEGIKTLEMCLPYYDYNGISLNNLTFINYERALKTYNEQAHRVHIALLETINQNENNEIIKYFVKNWKNYVIEAIGIEGEQ